MYYMMSLEGGKIWCVVLLYEPGKAGIGLIYEEPFRVILSWQQKTRRIKNQCLARFFNIDFLIFTLFFYIFPRPAETADSNLLKWLITKKNQLGAWIFFWWITLLRLLVTFWQKMGYGRSLTLDVVDLLLIQCLLHISPKNLKR